jgi:2-polyprenyl-6-methoxyphenol hydroxylase-like FAD-dependent oxidoreductase
MGSITEHPNSTTTNNINMTSSPIQTDILIVGAGPAGASLAAFLSSHGVTGLMISGAAGTADTPRAHITNTAALECLRDIGLEDECMKLGNGGPGVTEHYRWCETMAGVEYARTYAWGNDPRRKGDYDFASPCKVVDLPQTLLEPVLVRYATTNGFRVRFDTQLVGFVEDAKNKTIAARVRDGVSGQEYGITSKYLFGCDGARSIVAQQLQLPFHTIPGGGIAYNVLVGVDMSHLMKTRSASLNWVMRLERDYPFSMVARMVKPWYEWLFVAFPKTPDAVIGDRSKEEWEEIVRDMVGEDIEVKVLGVSKWAVNESVAERYDGGINGNM